MPEWAYVEIKRLCVNFIWDNRSHLVKYSSIVDEKCKGGLQLSDIKCKMYAFRLKYIGRLIDDQYHVLWKDIFKYFVSKIYGMQLGLEILYTTIPNCELKCIPMVYQEMCQALYSLGCKIDFQLTVENIYDQPLFCNPKIVLYDKTIICVEAEVGEGVVEACVPKSGNVYEITLKELEAVDLLCDTMFKVNNVKFKPNPVFSKQKTVSFLNVSYYVTDEEITKKLEDFGAELISPIKRRMHPGTTIADGTRYVLIRFSEFRQSLPYSMKFSTGVNSHEYIRVLHDN
ncbi:unnamed protein product [Mytilus coruscus]|uniref:Uncharacterized protein n=1 Tax=Mytilus coruscus TaxID=42192 RepID=A0A6J8ES32_MYTCO|nr:unnamed protein product [Mytilus coruscus]